MPFRIEGNEVSTNQDVAQLLKQIRSDPRASNPRVLAINQLRQMQAKNNGYPLDLHHDTLLATQVFNEEEEAALTQQGFRREYRHKAYPKFLFRRNMHPKFQKSPEEQKRLQALTLEARTIEMATLNENDYIEERQVKDEGEEKKLRTEKAKAGITTPWVDAITKIEPFPDAPEEDPAVTIANLRGQVEAMQQRKAG